jgi:nucleotide-binding universal stress UspA family protein
VARVSLNGVGMKRILVPLDGSALAEDEPSVTFEDEVFPRHVLVPVDITTQSSEITLERLDAFLPASGRRVTLATVLHEPVPFASAYLPHTVSADKIVRDQWAYAESRLEQLADRASELGVGRVEHRILVKSSPSRALLQLADADWVDLIALMTHGRSGAGRPVLESVADKLVRGAQVPVLAVPRSSS